LELIHLRCRLVPLSWSDNRSDHIWAIDARTRCSESFSRFRFHVRGHRQDELLGPRRWANMRSHQPRSHTQVCTSIYIYHCLIIYRRWQFKGLSWSTSFNGYKKLFKQWTGNYLVTEKPNIKRVKKRLQFSAALRTVVKADQTLYEISLVFWGFNGGTWLKSAVKLYITLLFAGSEDQGNTLSSISISSSNPQLLEEAYSARKLIDWSQEVTKKFWTAFFDLLSWERCLNKKYLWVILRAV